MFGQQARDPELLVVAWEVGELAEARVLHQLEHLLRVVPGCEVARDNRACTSTRDVLPVVNRFRRMLGEPAERTSERQPLHAAAPEYRVGLVDPLHRSASSIGSWRRSGLSDRTPVRAVGQPPP
jgi:hypothetical protein